MEAILFQNGLVYLDGRFRSVSLLTRGGKIAAVDAPPPPDCQVVDLAGRMLVPGFLDIHTHSGGVVRDGDLAVLDRALDVCATYVAGRKVWTSDAGFS